MINGVVLWFFVRGAKPEVSNIQSQVEEEEQQT